MLVAGIVLTVMILPIVSAVAREVFSQTPQKLQEGALALGATRWEMIRMTVLPFGKSSIISGAMLGLGRALGETMAVTIILSVSGIVTFNLISQANPSTIAANIALDFPESSGLAINTLIASGLVLFAITLVTNLGRAGDHRPPEHPVMEAGERCQSAAPADAEVRPTLPGWATYAVIAGSRAVQRAVAGRLRLLQRRPDPGLHRARLAGRHLRLGAPVEGPRRATRPH